jgi:hypothetical protein
LADITWTGVSEFMAAVDQRGVALVAAGRAAVAEAGALLEKTAKQNASGRPGPNVVTGTLRRSIRTAPIEPWGVRGWQTNVSPTVVYGRRVELGFRGADARGRHFNQRGYPYMGPAVRSTKAAIRAIYIARMGAAVGGL